MVKKEKINDKEYYLCEGCKFYYKDKNQAEKCQDWCNKNHSCNIEITKSAVNPKKEIKGKTCNIDCKGEDKKECSCC